MPRYFVNLTDDRRFLADSEGLEFPDTEAARRHALREVRLLVGNEGRGNGDWEGWRIEVTDEDDRIVLTVPMSEVDQPRDAAKERRLKAA